MSKQKLIINEHLDWDPPEINFEWERDGANIELSISKEEIVIEVNGSEYNPNYYLWMPFEVLKSAINKIENHEKT